MGNISLIAFIAWCHGRDRQEPLKETDASCCCSSVTEGLVTGDLPFCFNGAC